MSSRASFAGRSAILICAGFLLMFSSVAWFAAESKSPAYDEPYHAISSWLQLRYQDFRLDNEDPPLWQYWASLPNGRSAVSANFDDPIWKVMPQQLVHQWFWGVETLYRTPGNDPVRFVARCRAMMLCLAVLLGVLICYWSWQISGPIAAVVATAFFCLDPNFLAHSPLMKNDIAFAMSMFALALALWKAGRNLNGEAIGWIALLSVVTLTVKFSGLVAVMLVPLLLTLRALMPATWPVLGRVISNRFQRLLVAACITLLTAAICYGGIWAVYGFRFRPTPEKDTWLNLQELTDQVRNNAVLVQNHGLKIPGAQPGDTLPLPARTALLANQHGLLPQAFIAGFLFTYSQAMIRSAYLCGQHSLVGWWWYFPFAILVKTPISASLAIVATALLALRGLRRGTFNDRDRQWTALCLVIPAILFLSTAMASNLNIGIRHVLAIYPFAYVAVGCTAAALWRLPARKPRIAIVAVLLILAIESLSAFPDFIPYFNVVAANAPGGKLWLLGDSNLDWGQDLPLLVQWQQAHPNQRLYLAYFGYPDPVFYGLKYTSLPGGYSYDTHRQWVDPYSPSTVAISASILQGLLLDDQQRAYYARWINRKPIAVLGGSIYLFEYDPLRRNAE